ncbi:MAG: M90 family metallopeptidase [Sedimentisphaerales bacterium]
MSWFRKWRRNRIARRQFPNQWLGIIERNVPLYNRLPAEDKDELQRHILIFIAEKRFEGCSGLEITDEIKIVIAAQACMLLLHRKTDYYPGLSSILVYPHAFIVHRQQYMADGVVAEGPQVLSGESWRQGSVVLSWDDVKRSSADICDGQNVVFHEFAHQIDASQGRGDSSSVLKSDSSYIAWARVLQKDYQKLIQAANRNYPTLLNKYGATDPAEFFAVATEFFFEKSKELKQLHPDLYNELKRFYHQNPAGFK